jgi:NTE family protein
MLRLIKILVLSIIVLIPTAFSQTTRIISTEYRIQELPYGLSERIPFQKPMVALALSGGGARGLAQLGILRALEENGISPDLIIGTSMGSIVGGLYSSGFSLNELDSISLNTDWGNLLSIGNEKNRRELFVDQKVTEDKAVFSLRLEGFKPLLPTSINDGQKLSNYLNLLTLQAPLHVNESFNDLIPHFKAVCTDLVTGNPVILDNGSLSQSMRASSSVSFILSPMKIDSLILVDGGLVANIPVNIASNYGADFIMAVNTTSSLRKEEELDLPWAVADQVVSIPMKLLNEDQLALADFVLEPDLGSKSATDFTGIDSLINTGYKYTSELAGKIKHSIDSLYEKNLRRNEFFLKNVNIISPQPINEFLNIRYGALDSVSSAEILEDLYDICDRYKYKNARAEIIDYGDSSTVEIFIQHYPLIKEITLSGVTLLDNNYLEQKTSRFRYRPFYQRDVVELIVEILNVYRKKGFSLAELKDVAFNAENGVLSLMFEEGEINRIIVEGNTFTNENIIKREFPLKEGDFFRIDDVKKGLINIRGTNLFQDVTLVLDRKENQNNVVLKVTEKASSLLRVGFRVDNENKAQLNLDIRDENLFGSGTELGIILFGGTRNRAYIIEHKSNRIFDTYLTYKVNAFYKFNDVNTYIDNPTEIENRFSRIDNGEYRQIFYGTSIAIGTQVEKFGNLILEGKYQVDEIKNKRGTPQSPLRVKIASFKLSATVDSYDKYPYPEKGIFFSGFYESAQKILGADIGFTNIGLEYKSFITLNHIHTLSPRIRMGFADKTLPVSQLYSIGGQSSFFGMRENEFRGRQVFTTSVEYRFKFPFQLFFDTYLIARYDLGSAWEIQEQIRFRDLRHGVGGTISFDTPIGPADFSVGRSFLFKRNLPNNPISWGEVLFYFSVGYYY